MSGLDANAIVVAVGAVIEDDHGRVLLVMHHPDRGGYWQGKWICPGGKLEVGEDIKSGIKREVLEETSLEIELISPLHPFDRIVKSGSETALHVVYIDYLAKMVGGQLKAGSDVGKTRWVEKGALCQIWEELHEDTKKLLITAGMA